MSACSSRAQSALSAGAPPTVLKANATVEEIAGPSALTGKAGEEQQFFRGLNQFRALMGLHDLALDSRIQTAARLHSEYQAAQDQLTHDGATSSSYSSWDRMMAQGMDRYAATAENIACGQAGGLNSLKQLLLSPHHLGTMLDPRYDMTGIARAENNDGNCSYYWTNDFAGIHSDLASPPSPTLSQVIQAIETVCGTLTDEERAKVEILSN